MIISHKHKFVYVHIPKTGGTSIKDALAPYGQRFTFHEGYKIPNLRRPGASSTSVYHPTASEIRDYFLKMGWDWDAYFKFSFIRNPWDQLVSAYYYRDAYLSENSRYSKKVKWLFDIMSACRFVSKSNPRVEKIYNKFLTIKKRHPKFESILKNTPLTNIAATLWCLDTDDSTMLDFIGRFENLQEDFNTVCNKIGISRQELPHNNKSKHKHYTEYYTDETRDIVAEKLAMDIEYFGYKFGEDVK
jgi:hypothetical protein